MVVVAMEAVEAAAMIPAEYGPNNKNTKSRRVSQAVYNGKSEDYGKDSDNDGNEDDGNGAVDEDASWNHGRRYTGSGNQ